MFRPRDVASTLAALLCSLPVPAATIDGADAWSADETARIVALGPWPPTLAPDPSNRVSGHPGAIELGRRLFNDPRMSPVGYIACVGCHQTDRAFTDNRARAHGLADLPRNTPALFNLRLQRWYGWGGASDSLWMASLRPMLDAREFDSRPETVARLYRRDEELARCYRAAFGVAPSARPERVMVDTAKALAAFLETLLTRRTTFDDFRDALARGDAAAAAAYAPAARRGLRLFIGEFGCVGCHAGAGFSDGRFHASRREAGTDAGRTDDLRLWRESRFNLHGRYNDGAPRLVEDASEHQQFAFRTPGLRGVALTAPYLHDGSADTLHQAVLHPWRDGVARSPRPTETQRDDLLAFLHSLTDRDGAPRPAPVAAADCR